jgi:CDP-4-dehydro-6-deoxyglucose reductase, E1
LSLEDIREQIQVLVAKHAEMTNAKTIFVENESEVPASGKVIGAEEIQSMVDACLDGWLTTGRFNARFEARLARFVGVKHALTTNSGSSANLLALSSLTAKSLGERRLCPGDEVITVAAGFPTTVNPTIQNGLVPVFVDVQLPTYNIDVAMLEEARTERTKAIMVAHTLGNPFDLAAVKEFADTHNLWLIEDCCDALGSKYNGQKVGTFGDIATLSFYPAHHITMGEGGAVLTNSTQLQKLAESFRDWGRDCYCNPGRDNTCGKRYEQQLGTLPVGYDHKYTYSNLGYNLKITDMQAACGVAQLSKLESFIQARKDNYVYLEKKLSGLAEELILPEATKGADPAWFGYPITIRDTKKYSRVKLLELLAEHRIGSRLIFGGNLTRQPYFQDLNFRVVGDLAVTDQIMNDSFWIGLYPGLGHRELDHSSRVIKDYFKKRN